jgi:sulfur-carrier protein
MSVTVRIPTQLRQLTAGEGEISLDADTVRGAIATLEERYAGFGERLLDEKGELRRFVNLFVNDEDVRFLSGLDTPLTPGQTLSVVPAVAGGC